MRTLEVDGISIPANQIQCGDVLLRRMSGGYVKVLRDGRTIADLLVAQQRVTVWEIEEWLAYQSIKAGGDFGHETVMALCRRLCRMLEAEGITRMEEGK